MKKLALIIAMFGVGYLAQAQQGPATKPIKPTQKQTTTATVDTQHNASTVAATEKSDKKECTAEEKKNCGTKKSCCSSKKAEAKKD